MRQILLFIFILFNSLNSFSQEKFKDSIKNIDADSLITLSGSYQFSEKHQEKLNSIITVIKEGLQEKKYKTNKEAQLFRVLYLKEYYEGNFEKTITYANLSKKSAIVHKNYHYICLSQIITAQSYFELGDYEKSLNYHLESLKIANAHKILNLKIACKGNIGNFKLLCGDDIGAIEIIKKSISEIENSNNVWIKSFYPEIFSDLTLAYLNLGALKKASINNGLAITYSKKYNYYLGINLLNKALIETENKQFNLALNTIEKAELVKDRNHHKFKFDPIKYLTKGKIYYLKNEYENALKEFKKLENLQNNQRIHHLNYQEGLSYIAKIYTKLNKNKLALVYYNKALASFTAREQQKIKLISEITNKYDESQINEILKSENLVATAFIHKKYSNIEKEILKLNKEKNTKNNYLLITIISFLGITVIASILILKNRKRNQQKLEKLLLKLTEKEKKEDIKKKNNSPKLKDSEIERIIKNLNMLEAQEFYLKTDCTAANLAKDLETNTTYLSKVMNKYYQKTFTHYINDLRINYVLYRLKNDKFFRRYSIQSIANEIGFKSRDSFNTVFKKETGILPSFYIKELDNKLNT